MIKVLRAAIALALTGSAAIAGSAVFVAPEVAMLEEPMRNGSGAWLIPLAIIAVLALTLTNSNSCSDPSPSGNCL